MESIKKLIYRDDIPIGRNDEKTEKVTEPYNYLQQLPGNNKAIRILFIKAFNDLYFGIDNDALLAEMNQLVDCLHDCSLIIDDVEDSSEVRRGFEAAHLKFGVPTTVNCVNYMYFVAIHKANQLSSYFTDDLRLQAEINTKVNKVIIDEMLNLHHGQGIDIYWRDNKGVLDRLPSEEEYLEMVMDKTGGLLRIMVKLLEAFAPSKSSNHVALTSLIGMVYQLRDDYFNLTSDKYSHMKGIVGEDLIEGKFSFPILHSLRYLEREGDKSPVYRLLYEMSVDDRKVADEKLFGEAIEYMDKVSKSLVYTNEHIKSCLKLCYELIDKDEKLVSSDKLLIFKVLHQLTDT